MFSNTSTLPDNCEIQPIGNIGNRKHKETKTEIQKVIKLKPETLLTGAEKRGWSDHSGAADRS